MKHFLPVVCLLICNVAAAQDQVCPLNSNFSLGNLTHWEAYTGNNAGGNPASDTVTYDSTRGAPSGTLGVGSISEFNLPSITGIQVITANSKDPYGFFNTIPNVNGYQYGQTIKLGSTTITHSSGRSTGGGYVRGVSYRINVPPGPITTPYTMTYAYAMVLENGAHNSNQQPLFSATLRTADSVIRCASPQYYLPTFNNANSGGGNATLDTAAAEANGFFPSKTPSANPNPNGVGAGANEHLYDVWYKGWTEVTFDLAPYRGQQVTLTFETDNCVPGGHFAYSYIALRSTCGGLLISGDTVACQGSTLTYSVPSLAGATYQWQVPGDWSIVSGGDSSILQVKIGIDPGAVTAREQNSCANLTANLPVTTAPPTIAGALTGGAEVCSGTNSVNLSLTGARGSVLDWLASSDGIHYTTINDTTYDYTATNLTDTTTFRALVQNGESCEIDTAAPTVVWVDPQTVGGALSPASMQFCLNQTKDALLTLAGQVGKPVNWQSSADDGITWTDFVPTYPDSIYQVNNLTTSRQYRVVVQSGVCPQKNSDPASINIVQAAFPQATYGPRDTLICYGTPALLNANIISGTGFSWAYTEPLTDEGDGSIVELPYSIGATATPLKTTNYVLSVESAGCPNLLIDTFHVVVLPPIIVDAGHDTSIVVNQPLQLHATSNDTTTPGGDSFNWTPSTALDDPDIADPIATFTMGMDSVRYFITATSQYGCTGTTNILVKVFSTGPDIFVPNAFTPGGATNSIFRPIPVGIATLQYFRVYNRWGRLVYSTTRMGDGWDGRVNGEPVASGTYVWMVQGISYMGKTVFHKGTMILVR
ncbi:MAG TPA: gliding motility-associated C-terminal domain-containing protein [Puia sp.]|nr:gliding motility-associated C-terminal domain-containing protein [Puia sp.]